MPNYRGDCVNSNLILYTRKCHNMYYVYTRERLTDDFASFELLFRVIAQFCVLWTFRVKFSANWRGDSLMENTGFSGCAFDGQKTRTVCDSRTWWLFTDRLCNIFWVNQLFIVELKLMKIEQMNGKYCR